MKARQVSIGTSEHVTLNEDDHPGRIKLNDPVVQDQPDLDSFLPPRNRDVFADALMGATGKQEAGRALPALIIGSFVNPTDHATAAGGGVNLAACLINAALPLQRMPLFRTARTGLRPLLQSVARLRRRFKLPRTLSSHFPADGPKL